MTTEPTAPTDLSRETRIANLLHDLRNPLAGARGALQIVRDRTESAADKAILSEVINRLDVMAERINSARIDER